MTILTVESAPACRSRRPHQLLTCHTARAHERRKGGCRFAGERKEGDAKGSQGALGGVAKKKEKEENMQLEDETLSDAYPKVRCEK